MSATPRRSLTVTVNGKAYVVEVGDLSQSPLTVIVNGQPYEVVVEHDEVAIAAPPQARAAPAPMTTSAAPPMPARPAATVGTTVVRAPMPGNILDIAVQPGDQVVAGQKLCALEAMKMKSTIGSPRAARIAAVHVRHGQAVAYGDALFSLE